MSAHSPNGNRTASITEILRAFFQLDARTQMEIRETVTQLGGTEAPAAERERAEKALAALLQAAPNKRTADRVVGREERLSAPQRALRGQLDQTEAVFAATLARLMAERQLTQAQLAERVGVGQSAIAMLLKRRCRPRGRTLGKLAAALGVPVDELWPGYGAGWRSGVM